MKAPWTWTEKGKNSGYYSSLKDADGYPIIMLHDIYTGYAECGEELVMEIDDPVALLIAAAPDLLQELQNIANADYRHWEDGHNTAEAFVLWAKIRARHAISKAEEVKP